MTATTEVMPLAKTWEREGLFTKVFATVDHKRIGIRYMATAFMFFLVGGVEALLVRTQLAVPENDFLGPEAYNQVFTMHGTTMIFFFATPILIGLGNFLVPLMLGTRDFAFPRMNAFGYWVFVLAGVFMYTSFLIGQVPQGGWFAYVPLTNGEYSPDLGVDFWALGITFLGISTTAGAINFIVTILKLRAPGMAIHRLPLYLWSVLTMSFAILLAVPSLTLASMLLAGDRLVGTHFFDPGAGGNVLLWQHLFWFWGHPEVYILLLPSLGIISSVIAVHTQRPVVAYELVAVATVAIAVLSFGLWVHHMFATGLDQTSMSFFSAASFSIAIPSGISIFAWLATIYGGKIEWTPALLFAIGFVVTFVIGGISGVMVASVPFDRQVTDSFFIVAHFHYVLVGGVVFPVFAGLHHWWPKIAGRMLQPLLGHLSFWLTFIGFHVTFFPQHVLGLGGMPRRVYTYSEGLGWDGYNLVSTVGAFIIGAGVLAFVVNAVWSLLRDPDAPDDPWHADTLEWATTSPPEPYDFERLPIVHSREPLWDDRSEARHGDIDRVDARLPRGREVLGTSVLDGQAEVVLRMAEESYLPLITAIGLALAFAGALRDSVWWVAPGVILTAGALVTWLWKRPGDPTDEVRVMDRVVPPTAATGSRSPGNWGMAVFILTEAMLFSSLFSAYLLIRGDSPQWPPAGIDAPRLLIPAALTAILAASSGTIFWAGEQHSGARLRLGLTVTLLLGLSFLALQVFEYSREELTPRTNAYGSLFYAITGLHFTHLVVGVLMVGFVLARSWYVSAESARRVDLPKVAAYWHFIGVIWLAILSLVYVASRWL